MHDFRVVHRVEKLGVTGHHHASPKLERRREVTALEREVVVEDDESLLELINRRIRAIPGVRRTETYMYLTLRKHVYNYGTR